MKGKKIFEALSSTKWGKPILTVLGTIFLGALGSGFWDTILRDFTDLLAFALLKLIGSVYSGYLDSLHAEIAKGGVDRFSKLPYLLIIVFACTFPWFAVRLLRRRLRSFEALYVKPTQPSEVITVDEMVTNLKNISRKFTIIFAIFAVFISTAYLALAARDVYANAGAVYLDRSIEIIAPYIPAPDILRLRAAFRSIKTTDDFHKLDADLKYIAKNAKVELPKFRSLGK